MVSHPSRAVGGNRGRDVHGSGTGRGRGQVRGGARGGVGSTRSEQNFLEAGKQGHGVAVATRPPAAMAVSPEMALPLIENLIRHLRVAQTSYHVPQIPEQAILDLQEGRRFEHDRLNDWMRLGLDDRVWWMAQQVADGGPENGETSLAWAIATAGNSDKPSLELLASASSLSPLEWTRRLALNIVIWSGPFGADPNGISLYSGGVVGWRADIPTIILYRTRHGFYQRNENVGRSAHPGLHWIENSPLLQTLLCRASKSDARDRSHGLGDDVEIAN